jgi:signal transduction histidine kinase
VSPLVVLLIAVCESAGVGLLGVVVLRLLRRYPSSYSLVAVVGIAVCAMYTSAITVVMVTRSVEQPLIVDLAANLVAGVVAIGGGVLLGQSVMTRRRRSADVNRSLAAVQRIMSPDRSAELAELGKELTATNDELAESRRREQTVEASRQLLVDWISNDLRSPLTRLRDLTESIEDGSVADLPESCRKIRADTSRLTGIVDDLAELSRIQAKTLHLERRNVSLDDLVSDEVAGLGGAAGERGLRLRAKRIEPVVVCVDDRAITQVLNKVLLNAIQYSPVNTAVSVEVRSADSWAVVSVADECGGIPEQHLDSVFEMGWRDTQRSPEGGGLGLAIAQGIARAHEGGVSVHNVPGGCCFEVRLPLATR